MTQNPQKSKCRFVLFCFVFTKIQIPDYHHARNLSDASMITIDSDDEEEMGYVCFRFLEPTSKNFFAVSKVRKYDFRFFCSLSTTIWRKQNNNQNNQHVMKILIKKLLRWEIWIYFWFLAQKCSQSEPTISFFSLFFLSHLASRCS